jgi:GBP family porin
MNRKFLAAAVTAVASASASAQTAPTVEVYGILDAGLSRVTGLSPSSSKNSIISGIMDGSRLGFKGGEDLGGGYRALFTMEHRLELDTGGISNRAPSGNQVPDRLSQAALLGLSPLTQATVSAVAAQIGAQIGVNHISNAFWDRQIYLGLVTPYGAILAGRQYTPAYETSALFDTLGTQSSLALGQVAAFPPTVDIRVSNALAYRMQLGPVSGALMYAPDEGSTTTGRLLGGNAMYKVPAFSVGLGYNTRENERGEKSLTSLIVGGTVTAGPGTVYLTAGKVKDDHPTGLSPIAAQLGNSAPALQIVNAFTQALKQDSNLYHVGYKMVTGPNTVYVAYSLLNDKMAANADTASYGVAYTYLISKRTDLNMVVTRFDNKGLGQAAPGQAAYIGGVTASAGTDSTSYAFGMRHRF